MSSSLKDNLSSDYIDAFGYLLSKTRPDPVMVYVESEVDISFWRNILHPFENEKITFQINLPSAKGKKAALERSVDITNIIQNEGVIGKKLIVCVDSDYDYLLSAYRSEARSINNNPYIFQTYSYAIENLKCYSKSLHSICTAATFNDANPVDFVEFFETYSAIVYDLFVWNLYLYSRQDFTTFTISDFCKLVRIDNFQMKDLGKSSLLDLKSRVDVKTVEVTSLYSGQLDEKITFENSLKGFGLSKETTYLFIKGHAIFEDVVIKILKTNCEHLSQQKTESISKLFVEPKRAAIEIKQYINSRQKIESLLSNNTEFKKCFLYQKLHADLDRYVASLNP